jgi:hypothetical protein
MKWTPPGDLNGIEVPKSLRSVLRNETSGGVPCRIRPSPSMSQSPFLKLESLIVQVMSTSTTGCREISCPSSFAGQPLATVILEACSSSHHWARQFMRFGHDMKLLPPFYVRPYVHRSKTDRTDGKAMLEAWRRSSTSPIASDFFRGAPATLRLIYGLLIMEIGTRRILHFNQCHITIGDGPRR